MATHASTLRGRPIGSAQPNAVATGGERHRCGNAERIKADATAEPL